MHAAWNALIKVRIDRFASISLMTFGMGAAALVALPFVSVPHGRAWLFVVLSTLFHMGYKFFLVRAYESGDLAQAYPLARGTAPLLATIGGVILIREFPGAIAVAGIVLLCLGVLLMSLRGGGVGAMDRGSVVYAIVTSIFIACYTLSDGSGARLTETAISYAVWLYLADAAWTAIFCYLWKGPPIFRIMAGEWKLGIVTGLLSGAAYGIVMWAMTKAPIAAVAALRETSILFAMMISVALLGERLTRWRVASALLIVAGVVGLRVG